MNIFNKTELLGYSVIQQVAAMALSWAPDPTYPTKICLLVNLSVLSSNKEPLFIGRCTKLGKATQKGLNNNHKKDGLAEKVVLSDFCNRLHFAMKLNL